MKSIYINQLAEHIGKEIEVSGWVTSVRDHKKVVFVDLSDRSGMVQMVGGPELAQLGNQDVISVLALVKERPEHMKNDKIETGTIECEVKKMTLLSKSDSLPIDMGKDDLDVTLPILLDYRALTLRHPKVRNIFLIQSAIYEGFRQSAQKLGCIEAFVPTISAASTEGGAEVFTFKYYDFKAFLTQSPQLYKQILVPVFEKVFLSAHAYRAEPSVTTRHLAESTQLDCELGFYSFPELLDALEQVGTETLKYAVDKYPVLYSDFNDQPLLIPKKIPRLTLREAQEVIKKEFNRDVIGEKDLSPEDERDISAWAQKEHGSDFVTITHFPLFKRAFYTAPDPENPELSLSYDLLFRGLEVLSGSQRIDNYEELKKAIIDRKMDPDDFEMYLQAFKFGMPPHGGFSFGLERMTMKLLNLANIRQASLFPRDMERVDIHLPTHQLKNEAKEKDIQDKKG